MFGHRFFGASYFGPSYWGDGGDGAPPVVPVVSDFDYHDGKPRVDRVAEARRRYKAERDHLSASVAAAFERAYPQDVAHLEKPLAKSELKRVAPIVREAVNLEGFSPTLKQITSLLDEYQRFLQEEQYLQDDEDAVLVLLLVN